MSKQLRHRSLGLGALGLAALSVGLLASSSARADARSLEDRLHVHAPAECPPASELSRQIVEQLSEQGLRDAEHFEFELTIARRAGRYRGRLLMLAPQPSNDAREVEDADCGKLVRALALVIAVLIGPGSAVSTPKTAAPEAAPAEPAPPASAPPAPELLPAPLPALLAQPVPPAPPAPKLANTAWHLRVSAAGELLTGSAPNATLEPRLGLALEREPAQGATQELSASFRFGNSGTLSAPSGSAELSWRIARAALCEGYRAGKLFAAGPCLGLELGQLSAQGRSVVGSIDRSEPWFAATASARASLRPLASSLLFVELGAIFPFVRPNFYFQRGSAADSVYRVPATGFFAGAGAELALF